MKKAVFVVVLASLIAGLAGALPARALPQTQAAPPAQPQVPKAPPTPQPPIYNEAADLKADIAAALARASKENRRVLIQWGANWCGWCRLLHKLFAEDKTIARKLLYEYDIVMADVGRFDKNLDIAEGYKAYAEGFKKDGVPYLTVLDAAGNVVANQETASLESGEGHDPQKVLEFLTRNQAPYPKAADLLAGALEDARASGRRVFLHFGAPWCGWCKRLEIWMARPDVRPVLARDFVDLKIDQDRTEGGLEIKKRFPASEKSGIPWYAVLDPDGSIFASSTDGGSNIGYPATGEEIEAFGVFLTKAARTLRPEEIRALLDIFKTPGT